MAESESKPRSFWRDEAKLTWTSTEKRTWFYHRTAAVVVSFLASILVAHNFDPDTTLEKWTIGVGVFVLLLPSFIAIELYFRGREAGDRLIVERDAAREEAKQYKSGHHAESLELQRRNDQRAEHAAAEAAIPRFILHGSVYTTGIDPMLRIPFMNTGGPAIEPKLSAPPGIIRTTVRPESRIERGHSGYFEFCSEPIPGHVRPPMQPGDKFSLMCRDERGTEHVLRFRYTGSHSGFELDADAGGTAS